MRVFKGLLFLGSGESSVREADLLHERLQDGFSHSGGLQQSSQGMPEDEVGRQREEGNLEDVVRDLAAALLGREVTFGPELPYPAPDKEALYDYWAKHQEKLSEPQNYFVKPSETEPGILSKRDICTCTTHALLTVTRCQFHEVGARYLYEGRGHALQKRINRLARIWRNEKIYGHKLRDAMEQILKLCTDSEHVKSLIFSCIDTAKAALAAARPPPADPGPDPKYGFYGYHPLPENLELPVRGTDEYVDLDT